jgi:hypothetical protein
MRAHLLGGIVFGTAAAFVASAVALAQAPIPSPSWTAPVLSQLANANANANATATPTANATQTPTANATPIPNATPTGAPTDAGAPDALPSDAASPTAPAPDAAPDDTAISTVTPLAPPPPPPPEVADAGYEPSDVGFAIGLRSGYAIPAGIAGVNHLTDVVTGVIPIGVDVGWFINRHVYVGGYFLYGFALGVGNNLADCTTYTCSVSTLRFGAVVHYHFRPETQWDPWVGGGLGYDVLNTEEDDDTEGDIVQSGAAHGFIVNIESGIDFKPLKYVGLGPYVELTTGHYSSDVSATSLHEWLTFGIRLRTNL